MKDGMIIYSSYLEKFKKLSNAQFGELLRYILQYQMDGEVPEIQDLAVSVSFDIMKADLDRNNEKYQKVVERNRENGKKGGRPKNPNGLSDNPDEPKKPSGFIENPTEPKKPDIGYRNKDIGIRNKDILKEENKRFTPPTLEEVREYCNERHNSVDPERFIDFYASKGWMVGKNKMKDWKACIRTWEQRSKTEAKPIEEDENSRARKEKYAELEKFYLGV